MYRPLAAAILVLAATPARADDLQARLVAGARATDTAGYAFRETIVASGNGPGMDPAGKTYVNAYDPRRVGADRWRLVTVDGRAPTPKELERSRKARRDSPPTYADLAKWLGAPATRVDAGGVVTYRFARLPAGTLMIGKHDASADTVAEVQVAGGPAAPYVAQVRFTSNTGFRMMLVASVTRMAFVTRFHRGADGQVVATGASSAIAGSMLGKSGELRTTVAYADWQKVR